jgi:hypothetical protein
VSDTYREPSDADLDTEIDAAYERRKAMQQFYAAEMHYLESSAAFFLRLYSGVTITVPRTLIPGFEALTIRQCRAARLAPGGNAIIVNDDIDASVLGLLLRISGA